jgi:hypothetical protein
MVGFCENDNELLGSIKVRNFLFHLSYYQLLKKISVSWNKIIMICIITIIDALIAESITLRLMDWSDGVRFPL